MGSFWTRSYVDKSRLNMLIYLFLIFIFSISNGEDKRVDLEKQISFKADFELKTKIAYVNQLLIFRDLSTGYPQTWNWSFGDGSTSYESNPSHIYKEPGFYKITLRIVRENYESFKSKKILVLKNFNREEREEELLAAFSYEPLDVKAGIPIRFYDQSTGSIESRVWKFGYFEHSLTKNPIKIFYDTGIYKVTLFVKSKDNYDGYSEDIIVKPSPLNIIIAKSCVLKDVQAAIAEANPGDIVLVPPGKAMWNSKLVIDKGITLKGAGIDKTIIYNGYSNPDDNDETLILYKPSDYEADWPFRITGFTFNSNDLSDTIILSHNRSSSLTIQTKIRIDHNKFVATSSSVQAIVNNGMRGCVDNNIFYHPYPIRNQSSYGNGETWWNNWEGVRYGKMDNNIYFEDNDFYNVHIVSDCQYANRYVFRYNTINLIDEPYPLFDAHGNQGSDSMYGSFGVEIYGNLVITPTPYFGMRFFDHRGGKALVFMNVVTATSGLFQIKVRDEYPDSLNPETNPDYQFPNDAYYFLNRRNYTGVYNTVDEGEHSDNPPFYSCPTQDRDYFVGIDKFDGSSGVGYGPLSARPSPKKIGVGYWATDQNIFDLRGMVGRSPASPISGTLYKCTSSGEWTAYFTPLTYPHPLRKLLDD